MSFDVIFHIINMKPEDFADVVREEVQDQISKLDKNSPVLLKVESVEDYFYFAILQNDELKFHISCPNEGMMIQAGEEAIESSLKAQGYNIRINRVH